VARADTLHQWTNAYWGYDNLINWYLYGLQAPTNNHRLPDYPMTRTHRPGLLLVAGLQLLLMCGCGRSGLNQKAWHQSEVEVSPGLFIEVEERSVSSDDTLRLQRHGVFTETFELRIHWGGSNVSWQGHSAPVNLREFRGRIFLITFDRISQGIDQCFFRYYAQQANELKEIPPTEFPKAIAGQNMDLYPRYYQGLTSKLDAVKIALDQDPSDIYFRKTFTAYIWNHLATGEQYWQSSARSDISEVMLRDFIRTNKPIKLTAIVREVSKPLTPIMPPDKSP
jgi:hypothetical protein